LAIPGELLYDAVYSRLFREAIYDNLLKKRKLKAKKGDLVFFVNKEFRSLQKSNPDDKEFYARFLVQNRAIHQSYLTVNISLNYTGNLTV
jgi:hypothetical protein